MNGSGTKALGILVLLILVAVAALEIGGIAYAWMRGEAIAEVYPWSLLMADRTEAPEDYRNAWFVVAAIPAMMGVMVAVLVFVPVGTGNHGSARFARPGDLNRQGMFAATGVILGKNGASKNARLLRQDAQTHTLLVAPTGAGKGVGVIVPNLLTYGGSVVCIDVKGENWRLTAQARKSMGDEVYRFSPRSIDGCSHRWNPLSYISEEEDARRLSGLRQLATYLFPIPSAGSDGWVRGARNIFVGVCLFVLDHRDTKTLGEVYRTIHGPYGFAKSLKEILGHKDLDPECRQLLAQYLSFAEDQLSGYVGMLEPLNLWGDGLVDAATSGDDFDLRALRREATSIYLSVAPDEIEELAPLLRVFFQQVMGLMQQAEPGENEAYPVLMVMDEFRTLGKLETILSAITTIRSFGGRFLIVVQGLSNLVEVYGREGRDNIVQNCGFQVFYTMSDATSADYVSKRLGRKTVKQTSKSFGGGRTPSRSYSETGRDLMSIDEIGRLDAKRSIIIAEGGWPVKGWRIRYYEEDRFSSLVSAPPSPPLLKTRGALRPPAKPTAPATVSTPPSGTAPNEATNGPNAEEQASRAHLDAREAALRKAKDDDAETTEQGERTDAGETATIVAEIDRQVEMNDGPDAPDARFKQVYDMGIYQEAGAIAKEHGLDAMAESIASTVNDELKVTMRA